MKRLWVLAAMVAAVLVLPPLVAPLVVSWSRINCRCEDINIKTGQARYARWLWFIKVSERIEDTPLSLALHGETVDVASIRPWHRVNTLSPGVNYSPHYVFHSALHQAQQLERIAAVLDLPPERQREIARAVLTSWQRSGRDSAADEYLRGLIEEGERGRAPGTEGP
jgi:hypothetical protein